MLSFAAKWKFFTSFVGVGLLCLGAAQAQILDLEIIPQRGESVLSALPASLGADSGSPTLQRLDFLLSSLALQRPDGTWLESADWYAFFSLEKGRLKAQVESVPKGTFKGIRFVVGVPAKEDLGDPNIWPVDHPLNPTVNGLHWGWQGGYVYMAIEGRWNKSAGESSGFSYHIARRPNQVTVEIPVEFQGGGPMTLQLGLDLPTLLSGIDLTHDGHTTHSREGDAVVGKLTANIQRAFRLRTLKYDRYQDIADQAVVAETARPAGTEPYELSLTQRFPQVQLPQDNPLTKEGVALGKKLFHDTRLSINNSQSCASCHQQSHAFSDPRAFSLGAEGQVGKRHAMPLFNLAWDRNFFWDGRAKTLREQVLMPIQDAHEMNETLERVVKKIADTESSFTAAFGTPEITAERIAKSLEQYLLSLVSQESRFDRAARRVDQMTEEEKRGLQLFVTEFDPARGLRGADCFHCHGSTLFTDYQFKNNGLDLVANEQGRMAVTGNAADRGKFKTPSLRNIAVTAPYMHDGRFQTLEEVVEHYNSGVKRSETLDPNLAKHPEGGLQLTPEEKRALVAFLKTLTDEEFTTGSSTDLAAQHP